MIFKSKNGMQKNIHEETAITTFVILLPSPHFLLINFTLALEEVKFTLKI